MPTFETIESKVARRCRYHQHRGKKTTVTVEGSPVTGMVGSVMEVQSSNPRRWIITVIAKPHIAA
jgi:CRISPR/Cas system endoribonuclease Cas6 (RAMP superfamily)